MARNYLLGDYRLNVSILEAVREQTQAWTQGQGSIAVYDACRATESYMHSYLNFRTGERRTRPTVDKRLRVSGLTREHFTRIEEIIEEQIADYLRRIVEGARELGVKLPEPQAKESATAALLAD